MHAKKNLFHFPFKLNQFILSLLKGKTCFKMSGSNNNNIKQADGKIRKLKKRQPKKIKCINIELLKDNYPVVTLPKPVLAERSPLLLGYKYSINPNGTKFISVGFDPDSENFEAVVMIEDVENKNYIVINSDDWYIFFGKRKEVREEFENNYKMLAEAQNQLALFNWDMEPYIFTTPFSASFKIEFKSTESGGDFTKFDQQENKLHINIQEWNQLQTWLEFINTILTHYKSCTKLVDAYYQVYLRKCKENGQVIGDLSYFFTPQTSSSDITLTFNTLNYFRLYNEMANICFKRTTKHLEQA